jgi:hypothetical protein
MAGHRGRAGGGRHAHAGPRRTLTLLGAMTLRVWVAVMTIESPTDGDVFLAYVEQLLCPRLEPGQVVVMDNLAVHRVAGVRAWIEARGAELLYLPPYSPDFNPVEPALVQGQAVARFRQASNSGNARNSHHRVPGGHHRRQRFRIVCLLRVRYTVKGESLAMIAYSVTTHPCWSEMIGLETRGLER